ncbi:MAG: hypothetical protein J5611_03195 [Alphaproteobacteria bacterium]|nr:hypothetical protein [Alphaproteobacteria bacterium]
MGASVQVSIETTDPLGRLCSGHDKNVENGLFKVLSDLIKIDNIVWDPVGAFFYFSCGWRVHKYRGGGGAVYDSDDTEIFLTQNHIDRLFAMATEKKVGRTRGLARLTGGRER